MPTAIYDNIGEKLLDGLKSVLPGTFRADFCVGYFNLRGWGMLADSVNKISPEAGRESCRLIVGMPPDGDEQVVRRHYAEIQVKQNHGATKGKYTELLSRQLVFGVPSREAELGLRELQKQLRGGIVKIKLYSAHPLHAKLYLAHNRGNGIDGYVGSSNLTLAGLERQGELNVDVRRVEPGVARELAEWFDARWNDPLCNDITDAVAEVIDRSWAGERKPPISPYEIYMKTVYEMAKEAISVESGRGIPKVFQGKLPELQEQAVLLAVERLYRGGGVFLGDVVGFGKTMIASAVAKVFQEEHGGNVMFLCPANLTDMWNDYRKKYAIACDVMSFASAHQLKDMSGYPLTVIDESHNLRNRDSRRHKHIADFLRDNDSRAVLLSATPYNKNYLDISGQLRLFLDPGADLGIRPEAHIAKIKSSPFGIASLPIPQSSLAAFEQSEESEDWRNLLNLFMIRRTRNQAPKDENNGRRYLAFCDGKKFYFPRRRKQWINFDMGGTTKDQYAQLYSETIVDIIGDLKLPRYGLSKYLRTPSLFGGNAPDNGKPAKPTADEKRIIENLSRAGRRLIGFTRAGLFKRLESSGPSFLLSVRRHIVRNAIYLAAIKKRGKFPVGDYLAEINEDALFDSPAIPGENEITDTHLWAGENALMQLEGSQLRERYDWIRAELFAPELERHLRADFGELLKILRVVSIAGWDPSNDRKLRELLHLCETKHRGEKMLIFSEYADTVNYIYGQMESAGVDDVAKATGGDNNLAKIVRQFSPESNNEKQRTFNEIRVLVATDALSEGQNLQDAHIVVNFDLPWGVIRHIQRAGRVDRIGQKSKIVYCYHFRPADGVDKIINLRKRLLARMRSNGELFGDEEDANPEGVYNEKQPDDTDFLSHCYGIWGRAVEQDPMLKDRIERLPMASYSAKRAGSGVVSGALAHIQTGNGMNILVQTNGEREVISQSQEKILELLKCSPDEQPILPADNHHVLVRESFLHVQKHSDESAGGRLGGAKSVRRRLHEKLGLVLRQWKDGFFDNSDLANAADGIARHVLQNEAENELRLHLRGGIGDDALAKIVVGMWNSGKLLDTRAQGNPEGVRVVCSLGLVK